MIGELINNRYKIISEIGKGGMGIVYSAHDESLDRHVAIKILSHPDLGIEGRDRMFQEAQLAAKLDHVNIVTVFDVGEYLNMPYIVMQLVEGETLAQNPPVSLEESIEIIKQVSNALEHAHKKGIIHRDLKPENMIIDQDGILKLMDFGLARTITSRLSSEGTLTGTVYYMPPEQAQGFEVDQRADLYSLGVMFYEMVTGSLPFDGDDPIIIITQHITVPPVSPIARNESIPRNINDLIIKLMSKDPEDRLENASDVLAALEPPKDKPEPIEEEVSVLDRLTRGRLIGRQKEIRQARRIWQSTFEGSGQLLLVTGEPGIGKTRFTREIITNADISGGYNFFGACYAEGGVPYAPFRQILRKSLRSVMGPQLALPENVIRDILRLVPDLSSSFPDIKDLIPQDPINPQSLFESFTIFLSMLSSQKPILLVLEDVHWADSGSLALLRHLARTTQEIRLMIIATYREVEVHENRAFNEILLDLNRERLGIRIKLGRLDKSQTEDMLAALFYEEITPEFLEGIYQETEGHPFFIEEVVKALVESGKLKYINGEWTRPDIEELGIPQSIQIAIQSRLDHLEEPTQKILRQAAVIGREFSFHDLKLAVEIDERTLMEFLQKADKAQLIQESDIPNLDTLYQFNHALIPTTLIEDTRPMERRNLHLRAAQALEQSAPKEWDILGYHYFEGGDVEKALPYWLKAADRARDMYANQEAIRNYQQALDFLRNQENEELTAATMMKLAQTYQNDFNFDASKDLYEQAFALQNKKRNIENDQDSPPVGKNILRSNYHEPATLDPGLAFDIYSNMNITLIFDGLVEIIPPENVPHPALAQRWEILDQGIKYRFHLHKHALWSDGVPITAQDCEYAFKRNLSPEMGSPVANFLYVIKNAQGYHQSQIIDWHQVGVKPVDEYTLDIILETPIGYLLPLLADQSTFPVPRHVIERHGSNWTDTDKIVSSGPYHLKDWQKGVKAIYTRNHDYYGTIHGNVDEFHTYFNSDSLEDYVHGHIDMDFTSREFDRATLPDLADQFVIIPGGSGIAFLEVNTNIEPLNDVRVRRALTMALNKEHLLEAVPATIRNANIPANGGFIPTGIPGHSPDIGLPYDPNQARDLLAQAGFPGGKGFPKFDIIHYKSQNYSKVLEIITNQWKDVLDIQISPKLMEKGSITKTLIENRLPLGAAGWVPDYLDPHNILAECTQLSDETHDRLWHNQEFEELVIKAAQLQDQEKRLALYHQADNILVNYVLNIPLVYTYPWFLAKPWIKGKDGNFLIKNITILPHDEPQPSAPTQNILRTNFPEQITLDPGLSYDGISTSMITTIFDGLVEIIPPDNVPRPALAQRWEVLEQGLKYRFHLRKNARWSDGTPLTAHDCEFALKRNLSPEMNALQAKLLNVIKNAESFNTGKLTEWDQVGVKAVDDHTLDIHLESQVGYLLPLLANVISFPVPRHVIGRYGPNWTDAGNIVSSGPYRLKEWHKGEKAIYTRNQHYYKPCHGNVDELHTYFNYRDLNNYLKGPLDISIPNEEFDPADWQEVAGQIVAISGSINTFSIYINPMSEPFNDMRVRRALAVALNKDAFFETLYRSIPRKLIIPAHGGFIPPGIPGHSPGIGLSFDPDQARELLAQAGFPDGKGFPKFDLIHEEGRFNLERLTEIVDQWQNVLGIQIAPKQLDRERYIGLGWSHGLPLTLSGWIADYLDPHNFLAEGFRPQDESHGQLWYNQEFEDLVAKAAQLQDQQKRLALYRQADQVLINEAAIIPLSHAINVLIVKPWIKGRDGNYSVKNITILPH